MSEKIDYLEKILTANVYDVAIESPLDHLKGLSSRIGNTVLLKREDLQPVFSFKLRGAYNKIAYLTDAERKRGVLAASAGNHAQGVALAAKRFGCRAVIVMPETAPVIKVEAVRRLGGEVDCHGECFAEAASYAKSLAEKEGLVFIDPFDDPYVIAGQGTVGMEILKQWTEPTEAIFVPVGGGGLIAGVAAYVKRMDPAIKVIGVEPEDAGSMYAALKAGKPVALDEVGAFAEGVAVAQVGKEPFRLAKEYVDEVVLVNTDMICSAIKDVFDDTRTVLEPSGALAIAGLKMYAKWRKLKGKNLVAIGSGANINFNRLRHVAERAEVGEESEALFAVTMPERAGACKSFIEGLGSRNITEFHYRYNDPDEAHVFVGIGISEKNDREVILDLINKVGFEGVDLTDNEIGKLHIKHLAGGRNTSIENERIFRFQFPERPGALIKFLNALGSDWSVTLFQYRSYGGDSAYILVGLQIPDGDLSSLDQIDYPYWEETDNPACKLFL